MDGRVQLPVQEYLKNRFKVKYTDMITEPGPNGILAEGVDDTVIQSIFDRINISVNKHNSSGIAIVGHHDCAGNPVSKTKQHEQLHQSANVIKEKYPDIPVIKLWVNENWQVHEIE